MESRICPMNSDVKANALLLQQLIVGYGFRPTAEELINYLKAEEPGLRESFCIIPMLQDICKINPWDLPDEFNEKSFIPSNGQECWFICPRTKSKRISRKTPCGSPWKIDGQSTTVKAGNGGEKIGSKKILVFPSEAPTTWVIHEYHLLDSDLNRNYVLCHVMRRRDEKADNATTGSKHGANYLADLEWRLDQPDPEESFDENLIQAKMVSLIENSEMSVMDFTSDNGLPDEYIRSMSETSEEDEDVDYLLNSDLIDAVFFQGDQMQTMENRRTRTLNSLHGVILLEEKKCMVENKFSSSLVTPANSMVPPVRTASINHYGKEEVPRFKKVKRETAAKSIFFDEMAARAKGGQISITENRQAQTIGSLRGTVPLEQKEGAVQSKVNGSHASSTKPMELPKNPKIPKVPEPPRTDINEEPWHGKVKKQESASRNVKTESVSLDEAAATAKVLKYREHGSASSLSRMAKIREIGHACEKANSVAALTRPTAKGTRSSTNPLLPNLVNVLVGIFLLFAITCQVFNL